MGWFFKLIISLTIPFAAAAIGSLANIQSIPTWYTDLEKPFLNPPNFIFGPVWTVLYALIGFSLYKYWTAESDGSKKLGFIVFALQIILNTLWSVVFFGLQQPLGGVVIIIMLDIAVIANILLFYRYSQAAAWLLVPYLLWILFATYLTVGIWVLN